MDRAEHNTNITSIPAAHHYILQVDDIHKVSVIFEKSSKVDGLKRAKEILVQQTINNLLPKGIYNPF